MTRLPQVGGDSGSWGNVLNDFLTQSHNDDGTLRTDSVGASQLKPQSVTNSAVVDGTIQQTKLAPSVQAKLDAPAALDDGSVTTTKLADHAVTSIKLAGLGEADGVASLDLDGRVPEAQLPERLAESNLAAASRDAIIRDAKVRRGRMVAVGDSITEVSSSRGNRQWSNNWPTFAVLASAGRLTHVYTCAKGGWNTTDVYGLYQTEVIDTNLDYDLLVIADGTNDTNPLTTTLANNQKMIQRELSRGGRVALATIPPSGTQSLTPPTVTLTPLPGYSGGTLPAGTYYYQVATRGALGNTAASAEQQVVLSAIGAIRLDWPPVAGAVGYTTFGRVSGTGKAVVFISGPGTGQTTFRNQVIDLGGAASLPGPPTASDSSASPAVTSTVRRKISEVQAVKRYLGRKYGIPVVDQQAILTDWTAQGKFKQGYASDGTHPTIKVQRLMGTNLANKLATVLPILEPDLASEPFDSTNIIPAVTGGSHNAGTTGALLLSNIIAIGGGAGVRPAGWSYYGDIASGTNSLDTDPTVPGNVYTLTRGDSYGAIYSGTTVFPPAFAAGDKIYFAFKVKTTGLDAIDGGSFSAGVKTPGASANAVCQITISADAPVTELPGGWAVWSSEATVPAGATALNIEFALSGANVSAKIAQLTVRNLTALGLD